MQKQARTMGRSNSSTRSGHRSFVTGCASNAIRANLPAGPREVLVVLDGGASALEPLLAPLVSSTPSPDRILYGSRISGCTLHSLGLEHRFVQSSDLLSHGWVRGRSNRGTGS